MMLFNFATAPPAGCLNIQAYLIDIFAPPHQNEFYAQILDFQIYGGNYLSFSMAVSLASDQLMRIGSFGNHIQ